MLQPATRARCLLSHVQLSHHMETHGGVLRKKTSSIEKMSPLKVPIDADFFHCLLLSAVDTAAFRAQGHRIARDLIRATRLDGGPIKWVADTTGDKVQIHGAQKDGVPIYRAQTEVAATLDDMIAIFLTTSTADTREVNGIFFPNNIDKVRLYNLTLPTDAQPHFYQSISWALLQTPLRGAVFKYRDWCYIEHMEELIIDGRRAWVRALQHVDVDGCPDLQHPFGIVRARFLLSGFVYIESTALAMSMPSNCITSTLAVRIRYDALEAMETRVHVFKLSQLDYVPFEVLVSKRSAADCAVCRRPFGAFSTRANCRRCGLVVCGSPPCCAKWSLGGAAASVPICQTCSDECKQRAVVAADGRRRRNESVWTDPDDGETNMTTGASPMMPSQIVMGMVAGCVETQAQLASHQGVILRTLSQQSQAIDNLKRAVDRIDAKMSTIV
ncbi:Aste57867_24585 [Aphanomyces stellatus]|uniref:Aste57867_24585 protein n=1 Tax=Aphanomyces stellatus TaxID=120398 RepID=A0A485LSE1_9STRA|nr:hypothetical protein As57867_024507 [Aphanomyces stellatus]VFU01224.1 Aste57867_24585 [Aphanomyces stellatus]